MDLLPGRDELKPILNGPFYECGFNVDFNKLSFENQLRFICDIVRQSIYPSGKPNPDNDIVSMTGNCYTSSFVLMDYLKKLGIGTNHRCVLCRKRSFDLDLVTSIHVVLLVDYCGHTYQVDSAPFNGYKYGSVDDITYKGIYEEYVLIDEDINLLLNKFRFIIYNESYVDIDECIKLCSVVNEYPILKGYAALSLKCLKHRLTNVYDKNRLQDIINRIKPYNSLNGDMANAVKERLDLEYKSWYSELMDLKSSNTNYKRQLELMIWINNENSWYDKSKTPLYSVNGNNYKLSSFNPRFMLDNNLSCVINDKDISCNSVLDYTCDYRDKFMFNSFDGINHGHVYLFDKGSEFDGLINSHNPCESSLYFLSGFPGDMVMNKYMYPNPKFIKKLIDK